MEEKLTIFVVFQKKKSSDVKDDWIIRSLDLLSPFDVDFISDHLRRINCPE